MLGYAWKTLGWFLAIVAVALGFLLVPLQVAAERKKLDRTVSQIADAQRDIRALETEFDTRASSPVRVIGRAITIARATRRARGSSPYSWSISAITASSAVLTNSAAVSPSWLIRMSSGPSYWNEKPRSA